MTTDTLNTLGTSALEHEPSGLASRVRTRAALASEPDDYAEHQRTYRGFVRGVVLFVAHVLVILALMAYFLT